MTKVKIIKCCHCKEEFNYFSSKFRPFCSERCKMIDLGMWFNESYGLKSNENLSDNDLEQCDNYQNEQNIDKK